MTSEPPLEPVQRRVAVVPIVVAVIALMAFAVVTTIIITLAAANVPSGSAEVVASPAPAAPRTEETAPGASVVGPAEASTGVRCVDSTAEVPELDIDEVSVSQSDRDDLTIQFTLASAVPDGLAQLGIYARDADGERQYQFFVELDDGEIDRVTVTDIDRDKSEKSDAKDAEIEGNVISFEVSRSIAKKLGDEWSWFAFTTLDGSAIDACPGDSGSFETLTFDPSASSDRND